MILIFRRTRRMLNSCCHWLMVLLLRVTCMPTISEVGVLLLTRGIKNSRSGWKNTEQDLKKRQVYTKLKRLAQLYGYFETKINVFYQLILINGSNYVFFFMHAFGTITSPSLHWQTFLSHKYFCKILLIGFIFDIEVFFQVQFQFLYNFYTFFIQVTLHIVIHCIILAAILQ